MDFDSETASGCEALVPLFMKEMYNKKVTIMDI
jgi:hypothetical protein